MRDYLFDFLTLLDNHNVLLKSFQINLTPCGLIDEKGKSYILILMIGVWTRRGREEQAATSMVHFP